MHPIALPQDLYDEVKRTAQQTQISMADAMRQAIQFGLPKVRKELTQDEDFPPAAADASDSAVPPPKFKLVKKDGYTVIETDRKVSLETIKELLAEFP
ncbi:MAG: hypothetical protein JWR26_1253 [Pedosphaera sp.]|nr:hypothetical protein [Pedosphaera sp.]